MPESSAPPASPPRVGDRLLENGLITQEQIAQARARWLPPDILKIVTSDALFEGVT